MAGAITQRISFSFSEMNYQLHPEALPQKIDPCTPGRPLLI